VIHKDASRCMARDNEMQILWRSCGENKRPPFIDYRPPGWISSFSLGLGGAGQEIGLPSVPVTKLTRKLTNVTNSSDYDDRRDTSPAIRGQGAPVRAGQAGPPAASGSPLTRNGEPEAVLLSADDLEGLEMTREILGDTEAVARISESLAALGRGEAGAHLATVRQDLTRRCATGA